MNALLWLLAALAIAAVAVLVRRTWQAADQETSDKREAALAEEQHFAMLIPVMRDATAMSKVTRR